MLLLASQTIISVSKNADIWNFLMALLSYIFLMIDSVVYAIVNKLYVLFLAIAQFKIFDDRIMQNIINRAYIVVGVISLFIIAYALLSAIINPDTSGKNDKGFSKIVKNFIIAVIGIAMVPTIFNWFYYFQKIVLCNNTIPRLLLKSDTGTSDEDSTASDIEKATSNIDYAEIGPEFSTYLFQSFFFPSSINTGDKDINIDEAIESIKILYKNQNNGAEPSDEMIKSWQERLQKLKEQSGSDADIEDAAKTVYVSKGADNWVSRALGWASTMSAGSGLGAIPSVIFGGGSRLAAWLGALLDSDKYTLNDAYESAKAGNSFWDSFRLFILGDSVGDNNSVANGGVTYLFIFSTIAGGYCAYVLLNMCIDMALRAVKLGYLEIIAPFTVMTVVLPGKDSVFKTWKEKTISCALEVFVRVFIMSFTILIIRTVPFILKPSSAFCGTKIGFFTLLLLRALVYCGILTFAKKAPKFFSEVTGIKSDGFKLGIMDKLKESGVVQGLGAVGGGITAGVRNMAPGVAKGFATGGLGGAVMGGIKSLPSGLAGAASGTRRGWNKAKDAKKWSDVRTAAGDAADEAMEAKLKRQEYKDNHGGTTQGAIIGHIQDAWDKVKDYPKSYEAEYKHLQNVLKPIKETSDSQKNMMDAAKNYVDKHEKDIEVDEFEFKDAQGVTHTITGNTEKLSKFKQIAEDAEKIANSTGDVRDIEHARSVKNQYDAAKKAAEMGALSGRFKTDKNGISQNEIDSEIFASIQSYHSYITKNRDTILNNSGLDRSSLEFTNLANSLDTIIGLDLSNNDLRNAANRAAFENFEKQLKRKATINGQEIEIGSFIATTTAKNNVSAEANALLDKINEKQDKK